MGNGRCGDTGDSGYHLFSYRQGGHHHKEAIINNSDVFMLLDQSKFKDKFDDIKATLALTDIDCKKIFTINRLDNKVGRSPFKEVFIKRGTEGDVFGIEEPRECYMSYTTEKAEKEALKLYRREQWYR